MFERKSSNTFAVLCCSCRRTSDTSFTLPWAASTFHPASWSSCTFAYTSLPRLARAAASGSSRVRARLHRRNHRMSGRPASLRARRRPTRRKPRDRLWRTSPRSRTSRSRYRSSRVTSPVTSARQRPIPAEVAASRWKRRTR